MNIKRLVIENFKSIERIELVEPNPFTVFVGPNGSGKSNIFEALEFVNLSYKTSSFVEGLFGGKSKFLNRKNSNKVLSFNADLDGVSISFKLNKKGGNQGTTVRTNRHGFTSGNFRLADDFFDMYSRIFVKNIDLQKLSLTDNQRLSLAATNLEPVLKRILQNEVVRAEIFEWLELFVPGFKAVEVDDRNELHWFEEHSVGHFTKDLISDGTYNILALLTAVYQSEEPQFLCIEEPENGLHPQVLMTLVEFFRQQCEEKGHYIWLNTHSESIVRSLTTDEIVLVKKKNGATGTRQIQGRNLYDIPTDAAWLTGALGGGLAW